MPPPDPQFNPFAKPPDPRQQQQKPNQDSDDFKPSLKVMGKGEVLELDDIVGQHKAKTEIERYIRMLKHINICYYYGETPPNVLMHSPEPGLGKSLSMRVMASILHAKNLKVIFLSVNLQDFASGYINRTANRFKKTMKFIEEGLKRKDVPAEHAVVCLDEYDSMGSTRGESQGRENDKLVNALNDYLDGISKVDNISFVAATNRYDQIANSQLSRYQIHAKFLPFKDTDEISELFRVHVERGKRKAVKEIFGDVDCMEIAKKLGIVTGRDVDSITKRVVLEKMDDCLKEVERAEASIQIITWQELPERLITTADFLRKVEEFGDERKADRAIGFG